MHDPIANLPIDNLINNVDHEVIQNFVNRFSIDLNSLREKYREISEYNVNWAYTFNPLRETPLVVIEGERIICPIPIFLIKRVTNEIYFDLVKSEDLFSRSFGPAVQALIGAVAGSANTENRFSILSEARFGPPNAPKDSVDWIVLDETATLFIECKGSRKRFKGMFDLSNRRSMESEFDRICGFAAQAYRSIDLALAGSYPHWKDNEKSKFLMIVTLEDWQSFGFQIDRYVVPMLRDKLRISGVDPSIVDSIPLVFCPVDDFEISMYVAQKVGIEKIMARKNSGEFVQWGMGTFIRQEFYEYIKDFNKSAFDDEWEIILEGSSS